MYFYKLIACISYLVVARVAARGLYNSGAYGDRELLNTGRFHGVSSHNLNSISDDEPVTLNYKEDHKPSVISHHDLAELGKYAQDIIRGKIILPRPAEPLLSSPKFKHFLIDLSTSPSELLHHGGDPLSESHKRLRSFAYDVLNGNIPKHKDFTLLHTLYFKKFLKAILDEIPEVPDTNETMAVTTDVRSRKTHARTTIEGPTSARSTAAGPSPGSTPARQTTQEPAESITEGQIPTKSRPAGRTIGGLTNA
uniref:GMPiso00234 n=1 Tax=Galleria mellonella TaxID=7137 RepID=A0A3G1T1F6_GALME|nr:GMPiso00234 [Galleria mellonella]